MPPVTSVDSLNKNFSIQLWIVLIITDLVASYAFHLRIHLSADLRFTVSIFLKFLGIISLNLFLPEIQHLPLFQCTQFSCEHVFLHA